MEQFIKDCAAVQVVALADGEQALLIGDKVIQFKGSSHYYAEWIAAALKSETPEPPAKLDPNAYAAGMLQSALEQQSYLKTQDA